MFGSSRGCRFESCSDHENIIFFFFNQQNKNKNKKKKKEDIINEYLIIAHLERVL